MPSSVKWRTLTTTTSGQSISAVAAARSLSPTSMPLHASQHSQTTSPNSSADTEMAQRLRRGQGIVGSGETVSTGQIANRMTPSPVAAM
ncbi:hypothetical protein A5747_14700 [Mycobacterium sp. IS-836]|nr:hypothetical protein A5747_14700 [Mycobacterium sp. IS-836]